MKTFVLTKNNFGLTINYELKSEKPKMEKVIKTKKLNQNGDWVEMWETVTFEDENEYHQFIFDCDKVLKKIGNITEDMLLSDCKKVNEINICRLL